MATKKAAVQEAPEVQEAVQEAAVQEVKSAAVPEKPKKVKIMVPMDPLCEESREREWYELPDQARCGSRGAGFRRRSLSSLRRRRRKSAGSCTGNP